MTDASTRGGPKQTTIFTPRVHCSLGDVRDDGKKRKQDQ
jgi:hypothetical protein